MRCNFCDLCQSWRETRKTATPSTVSASIHTHLHLQSSMRVRIIIAIIVILITTTVVMMMILTIITHPSFLSPSFAVHTFCAALFIHFCVLRCSMRCFPAFLHVCTAFCAHLRCTTHSYSCRKQRLPTVHAESSLPLWLLSPVHSVFFSTPALLFDTFLLSAIKRRLAKVRFLQTRDGHSASQSVQGFSRMRAEALSDISASENQLSIPEWLNRLHETLFDLTSADSILRRNNTN